MVFEPADRIPEDVGNFVVQAAPGAELRQIRVRPGGPANQRAGIVDQSRLLEDRQFDAVESHADAEQAGVGRHATAVRRHGGTSKIQGFEQPVQRTEGSRQHDWASVAACRAHLAQRDVS